MVKKRFNWLIGENLGSTMNNNSWYYYSHVVSNIKDNINLFFVLEKSRENKVRTRGLDRKLRKNIVWKNSLKHQWLYLNSDMQFVTLSYKDVLPDIYRGVQFRIRPTIYLQHGNTGLKRLSYTRDSYLNSIFKFITYSAYESELLISENNFSSHQVYAIQGHPRYKELVRLYRGHENDKSQSGTKILWFLTWREYLMEQDDGTEDGFTKKITDVLGDERLKKYLVKNNVTIKVVFHQFFSQKILNRIARFDNVEAVHANKTDVMRDIADSDLLITDYSSLGFDFTFLNKPVILYQFDSLIYSLGREFYVDIEKDLGDTRVKRPGDLIDMLVSGEYKMNNFFSERLPGKNEVDFDYIAKGGHIEDLHKYLAKSQNNKVSILGYNFYGRGGTVSSTLALAEGLMNKGYMVELVSLKQIRSKTQLPGGLIMRSFMKPWRSIVESVKYRFFVSSSLLSYLNRDINKHALIPYVGYALRRFLKKTKSRTVISTRESIHLFVDDAKNYGVKNKLYFFHNAPESVNNVYYGVIDEIKKRNTIEKALFVSESSREKHIEINQFNNYKKHVVTGNALTSSSIIKRSKIRPVRRKGLIRGIVLTRLSTDRIDDIRSIINFSKYLKNNNINNIKIDVYGGGSGVYELCQAIEDYDLGDVLEYRGVTEEPHEEIRMHDFLVDFSQNHSFGMIYIESILNGVQCFAMRNTGSETVLGDIPDSIYEDWPDLVAKINSIHTKTRKDLLYSYDLIYSRYNSEIIASKVEELID